MDPASPEPPGQASLFRTIDLRDAGSVREALLAGARANREAACRHGSIERITGPGRLIATGDLHDNPLHLARLIEAAGLFGESDGGTERRSDEGGEAVGADPSVASSVRGSAPSHLVLHEIIHSDRLINGMDFSYRALARVAALKADFPELVHTLLANHELSQIVGAGIVKDGIKVVQAFNDGVEYAFGDDAPAVNEAIAEFVRSMPLALRCVCSCPQTGSGIGRAGGGDILISHSLPSPALMSRFDPGILSRDLTEEDYEPRRGSAHLMVWGRGYDAELLEDLVERWGVNLFILGHEKAENGVTFVPPCAIVLNSDHERGVYLPIDLDHPPLAQDAAAMVVPLASP